MSRARRKIFAAISGKAGPSLTFTGSTTLAEDFNGVAFTLVVNANPASDPYNIFAEVTDADNIVAISPIGGSIEELGIDFQGDALPFELVRLPVTDGRPACSWPAGP